MSDRASQIILLCEDEVQQRLATQYMRKCGIDTERRVRPLVASQKQVGGNDAWVLNEFSKQLEACRRRHRKAETLLVVFIDADKLSVAERRHQLFERAKSAQLNDISANDPLALLIPKRNVETWIQALLGQTVDEVTDYKTWKKPTREEFRKAAETLYLWIRPNAKPGQTSVPSLATALPDWKNIV
jgi:hypothetical protein